MKELKEKKDSSELNFKGVGVNYADILSDMVAHLHTGHYTKHTLRYDDDKTLSKIEIFEGNGRSKGTALICKDYIDSEGFKYEDFIDLTCYIMQLGIQAIIDGVKIKFY